MSVFRKILSAEQGLGTTPPPPIATMAIWLHALLSVADAGASGPDVESSVPDECARRLLAAGVSPAVAEHVRTYANNLGF